MTNDAVSGPSVVAPDPKHQDWTPMETKDLSALLNDRDETCRYIVRLEEWLMQERAMKTHFMEDADRLHLASLRAEGQHI